MIVRAPWVLLFIPLLLACEPAPRSESFFIANPGEADAVLAACERGDKRGEECDHAQASRIQREKKARLEFFQRGVDKGAR